MRITEIHIHPVTPNRGLIAFANLVMDNQLFLGSIAIHEKRDGSGYRLTFPRKGTHYLFHPIRKTLSAELEQVILDEVKKVIGSNNAGHGRAGVPVE